MVNAIEIALRFEILYVTQEKFDLFGCPGLVLYRRFLCFFRSMVFVGRDIGGFSLALCYRLIRGREVACASIGPSLKASLEI